MGNPLPPFISEILMANLETKLASADLILRFWTTSAQSSERMKLKIRSNSPINYNIEFTLEMKKEYQLSFLSLL